MSAADTVSILAGGWSAAPVWNKRLPGHVICVNEAMVRRPCDSGVTMDRLWTEHRYERIREAVKRRDIGVAYARLSAIQNLVGARVGKGALRPFRCDHATYTMSNDREWLNGTNSGICAINLAWHLKPKRVILFGFDMNTSPDGRHYWHEPHPWAPLGATTKGKYMAWAEGFNKIAEQFDHLGIEVLNASPTSAVQAFPKVKPESVL